MNVSLDSIKERFLKYVKFETTSDENSTSVPSTEGQLVLGKELVLELSGLGLDVSIDKNGYVMAVLPATKGLEHIAPIGFIAHMDTSPEMTTSGIKPKVVEDYDGKAIILNEEKNIVLSPEDFPNLQNYIGHTIITTDGKTLLGADDKAGITAIMTAITYIASNPTIPHGKICIGFTPDEEVGRGADYFDVVTFGAKYAYTIDGGPEGELEYESFNAAGAKITIHGKSVHPGTAKNKMINSILIGTELISMLPVSETPMHTEGYEGFYHVTNVSGTIEQTNISLIIRDHDSINFAKRKAFVQNVCDFLRTKYGEKVISLDIKDQYYNMGEKIEPVKFIVDVAKTAMEKAGIVPDIKPIRGGTDGARLSFMGLPTPNIFTGGENFHGKFEFVSVNSMASAVKVIANIINEFSEGNIS